MSEGLLLTTYLYVRFLCLDGVAAEKWLTFPVPVPSRADGVHFKLRLSHDVYSQREREKWGCRLKIAVVPNQADSEREINLFGPLDADVPSLKSEFCEHEPNWPFTAVEAH